MKHVVKLTFSQSHWRGRYYLKKGKKPFTVQHEDHSTMPLLSVYISSEILILILNFLTSQKPNAHLQLNYIWAYIAHYKTEGSDEYEEYNEAGLRVCFANPRI